MAGDSAADSAGHLPGFLAGHSMRGADVDAAGGMATDKVGDAAPDAAIGRGGGARGRSGGRVWAVVAVAALAGLRLQLLWLLRLLRLRRLWGYVLCFCCC